MKGAPPNPIVRNPRTNSNIALRTLITLQFYNGFLERNKTFKDVKIRDDFTLLYKQNCVKYAKCKLNKLREKKNTNTNATSDATQSSGATQSSSDTDIDCLNEFETTISTYLSKQGESDNWDDSSEKISDATLCPNYIENLINQEDDWDRWVDAKKYVIPILIIVSIGTLFLIGHGPSNFENYNKEPEQSRELWKSYIFKKNKQKKTQEYGIDFFFIINFLLFIFSYRNGFRHTNKNVWSKHAHNTLLAFGILCTLFYLLFRLSLRVTGALKAIVVIFTITVLSYNVVLYAKLNDIDDYNELIEEVNEIVLENDEDNEIIEVHYPKIELILFSIIINIFSVLFLTFDRLQHKKTRVFNENFWEDGYFGSRYTLNEVQYPDTRFNINIKRKGDGYDYNY